MNNQKKSIKIYMIATEPSGDVIGSNLIKSLKKTKKNRFKIFGIGGPKMIKSGLTKSLFQIKNLPKGIQLMEIIYWQSTSVKKKIMKKN